MHPIPIPAAVVKARPYLHAKHIGPPPGVSERDCDTVEALVGWHKHEGIGTLPMFCDYWRPNQAELEALNNGGFIELIQYVPQMAMHSMIVWAVTKKEDNDEA